MDIRWLFVTPFVLPMVGAFAVLPVGGAFSQKIEPVIFAPGVISASVNDAAPAFSPDGNTVYFHRSGPSLRGTILVSHGRGGIWSKPEIASFFRGLDGIETPMAPGGSDLFVSCQPPAAACGQG